MKCTAGEYSTLLGIPGEGVHTHYFGIALFDVLGTILVAEILSYSFGWNIYLVLVTLFLAGIVLHRYFCVRTVVDQWLFP
jgi:hypothetical protein